MFERPSNFQSVIELREDDFQKIYDRLLELEAIKKEQYENMVNFNTELCKYVAENGEIK